MLKDIIKVQDRVEELLKNYPQLRDNDKKLWIAYLSNYHNLKNNLNSAKDPYLMLETLVYDSETPTLESITRARRKIQEAGRYVGEKRKQRLEEE